MLESCSGWSFLRGRTGDAGQPLTLSPHQASLRSNKGALMLSLLAVLALSACGTAPMAPETPVASPVRDEMEKGGVCDMHIEEPEPGLYRAVYDTLAECGGTDNVPAWVLTDYTPDHLDWRVSLTPGGKHQPSNKGWYMRAYGPTGGPYNVQARAGVNNGRANLVVVIP